MSTDPDVLTRVAAFVHAWRKPGSATDDRHWCDPLGVQTRIRYRAEWGGYGGQTIDEPKHSELLEWLALGEALAQAGAGFGMIELGAGHGPWLMRAGVAWRHRRGAAAPLQLIGIEGEPTHAAYMREHAMDNGLAACLPWLRWGAVGTTDGEVTFEVSPNPAADWGTRLAEEGETPLGLPRVRVTTPTRVHCWSLATLLREMPVVDLLHVDIQGTEAEVLLACGADLGRCVRRIFVGTHGRGIEARLFACLPELGFALQAETACVCRANQGRPVLIQDGAQYWINVNPLPAPE